MADLMHQFEIKEIVPIDLGGYNVSFTNSSLFMLISALSVIIIFSLCLRKRTLIPNIAQSVPESAYEFIYNMINDNIGKDGLRYISFLFTLFLFVLAGNILGLFPYSFTFTSHFATVGAISVLGLLFNMIIGIKKRKWGYLRTFLPKGIPLWLAPLIIPIEVISLLSKSFSLTVRLVMNMVIGHIVLKVFAGFIACLQAYIYTILSCIYLGAALHEH